MTTDLITEDLLTDFRKRRAAGEGLKGMAGEIGVTWQKLDKAIRNGIADRATRKTTIVRRRARKADQAEFRPALGNGL